MMLVAHQPHLFPWLGFLKRWKEADVFMVQDNVQFNRKDYVNRCELIDQALSRQWMTVPVKKHHGKNVDERILDVVQKNQWLARMQRLVACYGKGSWGRYCRPVFETDNQSLLQCCMDSMWTLAREYGISTPVVMQSTMCLQGDDHNGRIIDACRKLGCNEMVCGIHTAGHLDVAACEDAGVKVVWHTGLPVGRLSGLHYVMRGGEDRAFAERYLAEPGCIQYLPDRLPEMWDIAPFKRIERP